MPDTMKDKSEDYWKQKLTPQQYHALREKGTEMPGSGEHLNEASPGKFVCAGCGNVVFASESKYESTTPGLIGWPSFSEPENSDAVELVEDTSHGMHRTEAVCSNCGGHLGHLFDDSSSPNGKHFCINSVALDFEAK